MRGLEIHPATASKLKGHRSVLTCFKGRTVGSAVARSCTRAARRVVTLMAPAGWTRALTPATWPAGRVEIVWRADIALRFSVK